MNPGRAFPVPPRARRSQQPKPADQPQLQPRDQRQHDHEGGEAPGGRGAGQPAQVHPQQARGENWRRFRSIFVMTRTGFGAVSRWYISPLNATLLILLPSKLSQTPPLFRGWWPFYCGSIQGALPQKFAKQSQNFWRKLALIHICQQPVKMALPACLGRLNLRLIKNSLLCTRHASSPEQSLYGLFNLGYALLVVSGYNTRDSI